MGTAVPTTFDPSLASTKAIQQQESWDQLVERTLRKEQEHKERKMRKQQMLLQKMSQGDLSMLTSVKPRSNRDSSSHTVSTTGRSLNSHTSVKTAVKSEGASSQSSSVELDIIVSSKPVLEKPKAVNLSLSQSSSRTNGSRLKVSYSVDYLNDDEEEYVE